jgi:hypothetical protein
MAFMAFMADARLQFIAIELLELLDGILIDRIAHVKHLKTPLPVGEEDAAATLSPVI